LSVERATLVSWPRISTPFLSGIIRIRDMIFGPNPFRLDQGRRELDSPDSQEAMDTGDC
jgi:hypothetical protein